MLEYIAVAAVASLSTWILTRQQWRNLRGTKAERRLRELRHR